MEVRRGILTADLTRRSVLGLAVGVAASAVAMRYGWAASSDGDLDEDVLSEGAVLRDPDVPVLGNPDGDITIVEFSDYQCSYCRKVEPDLADVVREDGKVRLVVKDWPILGPASIIAAKFALASKYQNKYAEAHRALLHAPGKLTEASAKKALANASIDVDRAIADMEKNNARISALLKRANDQATAFGFNGTPSFIIGKFRVPGPLSKEHFKLALADARKAAAKQ